MPYQRYSDQVEQAECDRYAQVPAVNVMVTEIGKIQFALQSERTEGLRQLNDLQHISDFYSDQLRFPNYDTVDGKQFRFCVIDLDDPVWSGATQQVRAALNYKAPDVANTNKDMVNVATNSQMNMTNNKKNTSGEGGPPDDANKCITSISERDKFEKSPVGIYYGDFQIGNH